MPTKKTRKSKCCRKCGRRSLGHVGPTGKSCSMPLDDLHAVTVNLDSGKSSGKQVEHPVESDVESSSSSESEDESVKVQLKSLTSDLKLLAGTVQKLVQRDVAANVSVGSKGDIHPSKRAVKKGKSAKKDAGKATPVTTATLAKDGELNCLLDEFNSGEKEFL
jgi:hypothetical protein